RKIYSGGKAGNALNIKLDPLQSMLLVFEPEEYQGQQLVLLPEPGEKTATLSGKWTLQFHHVNGSRFEKRLGQLQSFGTGTDSVLNAFAGTIIYKTDFISDGADKWIELGNVNRGVTEVFLNGKKIGINWYGRPLFFLGDALQKGKNNLEIKYTSMLVNYCKSLI